VLAWIEGETFTDRSRLHPYLGDPEGWVTFTDEQVVGAVRLLRRYHDALGDQLVCHGDFGPWNLVWRDGLPVAVIDFDAAYRGEAAEDVAYALRTFLGYGFVPEPAAELVRRTRIALDAYGTGFDVAAILEREYDLAEGRCRANGWNRQLAKLPLERAWLRANRAELA
jgi:Ser/Thr protein kinase RdoA (MazF antagonist)